MRSTLAQAGAVKDALERGAREGKHRLDDARRERRREQALARLGQAVLDALHAGEAPELMDRAEVADALAELDDLDQAEDPREDWVAPPTRERYDRGAAPRRTDGDDDGTVSSSSWRPPSAARAPVWRPPGVEARDGRPARDDREEPERSRRPADEPGARFQERPRAERPAVPERQDRSERHERPGSPDRQDRSERHERPAAPERRRPGGIQFEDDDSDLAEFMHPDDLPPRSPRGS